MRFLEGRQCLYDSKPVNMELFCFCLFIFACAWAQESKQVDYYVSLISEANSTAYTYVWPKNAQEYESSGKRSYFGTYDFVVVGGGSAGTTLAARLVESNFTVLVLEAGQPGNDLLDIPGMFGPIQFTNFNWAFNSTPQKESCRGMVNHRIPYPRGKGLGGSSLINVLGYFRGYKSDYDQWASIAGDDRWGYDSVTRYFKSFEHFVHRDPQAPYDPEFHGTGGSLRVEYHLPRSPQLDAFLDANKELGFYIADYNANKLGASPMQFTMINGTRLDDAKAFLDPVRNRRNLKVLTESYVTKIRLDKKRRVAEGVEFSHKGRSYFVAAGKEVILTAGAFGSAQILMLSGVGPRDHLTKLGIDVVADLEVGTTFLDHVAFYGTIVSTNYTEPTTSLKDQVEDYLNGLGPLTIGLSAQGVGFYESSYTKGTGTPDIEIIPSVAQSVNSLVQRLYNWNDQTYEDVWKYADPETTMTFLIINLHSESRGTFRLKSKNPYDYPLINPNFLSDRGGKDIRRLYEGVELIQQLLETKAFKAMGAKLEGPVTACEQHEFLSEEYWYCALRQVSGSMFHPTATCKMGRSPKEGAVVDSKLRVFGFKNLRVADTSVIPLTLASHTHAPTVMVAEQLGDIIKEKYKK